MASAEYNYTTEYDYVSPSMYAYAKSMNARPARPAKSGEFPEVRLREVPAGADTAVAVKKKNGSQVSAAAAARMVILLLIIGALLIGIVWTNAKSSQIKYNINVLEKQNSILQNDITLLNIEIEGSNSIQAVEEYATSRLGMVYASGSHCIYLENTESSKGLADIIKAKAYEQG